MPEVIVEGRRAAYLDQGTGTPVVLLHAGGSSAKQWGKIAPLLQTRFRTLAPDLWGAGGTDSWTGEEKLTHDDQALLITRVIEETRSGPVHLVGHSYGGASAVRLALRRRDLIKTLILIEPLLTCLLKLAGEEAIFREWLDIAESFVREATAGRPDAAWRGFINYRNGSGAWEALPESTKERLLAGTASGVAAFHSNLTNPTSIDDLHRIHIPTLVLCGENTTTPDRRTTEIVREHIPGCRYVTIPAADHMSPMSHPEFIANAIHDHIRSTEVAATNARQAL